MVNTAKSPLPITKIDFPKQLGQNNLMDSLMSDLRQNKFATVPARRLRARPGLFDNIDRDAK